ncbi:MAG: ferritin-like domain-containing protein [Deltaproteobacteria bacterium]|nr:ferritin-like domain-containing protein [Deltaproteobacteria bacterium]
MSVEPIEALVTAALSGTPIEKEYELLKTGLARCGTTADTFDAAAYDPRTVVFARDMWLARMEVEHRSTSVFSQLATQLMEANASLDCKAVMLRMAYDELRHTENCADVVRAMGGVAEVPTNVAVAPLAVHRGCTPEERALRNVIYTTCMSEMVAVARFVDSLDEMTDPYLRDRTRLLLADEILHGQFGFHYLTAWKPWLDAHPEAVRGIERFLTHGFSVMEDALAGPPTRPIVRTPDEIALGLPDPSRARDIFFQTMEHATVPGIERFGIDAGKAWRERRKLV